MTDFLILIGLAVFVLWLLAIDAAKRELEDEHRRHWEDGQE